MNKCKKCGEPAPEGRELCWCCQHTKLHTDEPKPTSKKCSGDGCEIVSRKE